jgi:hypothetical protein
MGQCKSLDLNRSGIYYTAQPESNFNLSLMQQMDKWMLDDPTLCVLSMQDMFCDQDITINVKRIGRLMR